MFIAIGVAGCDYKDNVAEPGEYYLSIIEPTGEFGVNYNPKDIGELENGGYVVLSSLGDDIFKPIDIIGLSSDGKFEWEFNDSSNLANPLPLLIKSTGDFYFFAINTLTLAPHLVKIDAENKTVSDEISFNSLTYPLAVSEVPGGYILLTFDRIARRSYLTKLNQNFTEVWTEEYNVFENPPEFDKYLTGAQTLPFYAGYVGSSTSASYYYFSGFNNQRIALTFVDPNTGAQHKTIDGHRYEAGVSSLFHLSNNDFFLSKYNTTGENSLLENTLIDLSNSNVMNSQNEDDVPDNPIYEVESRASFINKAITIDGNEYLVSATSTNSNRMRFSFHNRTTGALIGRKYFGEFNPYEVANYQVDDNGDFVILASTKIAGKFSRVALYKLSNSATKNLVN